MAVHKKKGLWILGSLIFFACILFAGWHFFKKDLANPKRKIVKPLLTDQIKKFIGKASDGLYHINIAGLISISILGGRSLLI